MTMALEDSMIIPQYPPRWADVFGEDDFGIFAECGIEKVRFVWRWICPGRFRMGCDSNDKHGLDWEKPQHDVVMTRGFWLGETPVTQEQWQVASGNNPSRFKGPRRPVEQVNWHDSNEFVAKLNRLIPGIGAALPTEAQWEYGCRAGTQSSFNDGTWCTQPNGEDPALSKLGWFNQNSKAATHDVKGKKPNVWGLYDMHGNVWEWCRDVWDGQAYANRGDGIVDPEVTSEDKSALRVVRGGSWGYEARICRAACRSGGGPAFRGDGRGFRLAAGQGIGPAAKTSGAGETAIQESISAVVR